MQTLNKKLTVDFNDFKQNNRLYENKKDDNDILPDGKIEIRTPGDIVHTIHYLLDYLDKYILVNDIMDFSEIYYTAKKEIEDKNP
jgi:hypothetical protein